MSVHGNINLLSWESDFFLLPTGRLELAAQGPLIRASDLDQYALVQAKVAAQQLTEIDKLCALGFFLAEGEVDLLLNIDVPAAEPEVAPWSVIPAREEHIPALCSVASQVFRLSRFRSPWYQPEDSGRFYALWAEKAVLGTFDHCCLLVVDEQETPQGFVTLRRLDNNEARIGLLAAWPGAEGRGVGRRLMYAAQAWCCEQQCRQLRIATQMSNIHALKLYTRQGATPVSVAYWLYRGLS